MSEWLMHALHFLFAMAALGLSWIRCRSYLHPHFLFTVMIVVFLSDFIIRGYADPNIIMIGRSDLFQYQAIILAILAFGLLLAGMIHNPRVEAACAHATLGLPDLRGLHRPVLLFPLALLGAELLKRLAAVNWSVNELVLQSLGPRGQSAWDIAANSGGNFAFALVTIALPLAALSFAYLIFAAGGITRIVAVLAFAVTFLILFTSGSRTPMVLALGGLGFFAYQRFKGRLTRLIIISLTLTSIAYLSSLSVLNRSEGFLPSARTVRPVDYSLTYHQDDSYYRALFAFHHADSTGRRWDAGRYFGTVLVNPVPRALWPEKPRLNSSFYDGYKLDYVTTLFLGEIVPMTGVTATLLAGPAYMLLIFYLLHRSALLLERRFGLVAYMIVALYEYMCMRSLMNITLFSYLPIGALLLLLLINRRAKRQIKPPQTVWQR
jgi:hypothetical protein